MAHKRIYIAAPWIERETMPAIAKQVEARGWNITHKWWEFEGEEEDTSWEFKQLCAAKDIRAVRTADVVLLINSVKSEGKAVEQGIALAYGIPIVIVGDKTKRMNLFQTLNDYWWVKTVDEALHILDVGVVSVTGTESI